MAGVAAKVFVERKIAQRRVMLFSRRQCPLSLKVKAILATYTPWFLPEMYEHTDIEKRQDVNEIEDYFQIICFTNSRPSPALFVMGKYIGGFDEILRLHLDGKLKRIFAGARVLKKYRS